MCNDFVPQCMGVRPWIASPEQGKDQIAVKAVAALFAQLIDPLFLFGSRFSFTRYPAYDAQIDLPFLELFHHFGSTRGRDVRFQGYPFTLSQFAGPLYIAGADSKR